MRNGFEVLGDDQKKTVQVYLTFGEESEAVNGSEGRWEDIEEERS